MKVALVCRDYMNEENEKEDIFAQIIRVLSKEESSYLSVLLQNHKIKFSLTAQPVDEVIYLFQ